VNGGEDSHPAEAPLKCDDGPMATLARTEVVCLALEFGGTLLAESAYLPNLTAIAPPQEL